MSPFPGILLPLLPFGRRGGFLLYKKTTGNAGGSKKL